jgi:hypothetical protein
LSKKPRIVHVLGKGEGWEAVKKLPKGSEIYGINDAFLRTPEVTKTFHMHDLEEFLKKPSSHSSTNLCIQHANANPDMEFFTLYEWKRIPHSKEFPLDEISQKFKTNYFTSTIEYAIAYALWEGVDVINLLGINMTVKQEYIDQKPGCEFWMGIAKGMGVEVRTQEEHTSLLKTRNGLLYGYNIRQYKI